MAKQGLTKSGFKDPIGLKLERTRREEKGKERRRGEEEEEGEKFKQSSKKVWNFGFCVELLTLCMDACLSYEVYMDIRDPSMVLIQEFLGYDC